MIEPLAAVPHHLYIHVPFCLSKCGYCAFYSVANRDDGALDRYVDALIVEAGQCADGDGWKTIYLGGGTPSILGPDRVGQILSAVGAPSLNAEVTLEINPETVAAADFDALAAAGVNRVSIGVQSFSNEALAFLGRAHDFARAADAVAAALDSGLRVSIDLIYGLAGQSADRWRRELDRVPALGVEHLSAYELTWEPNTPLGRQHGGGRDDRSELFFATHEHLASLGFQGYEVSSFAGSPDARSRHNLATWSHRPYLGLGPGAHSLLGAGRAAQRRWNEPDLAGWLQALERGAPPPRETESLTPQQRLLERVMLGLRTTDGIDVAGCVAELGLDLQRMAGEHAERLAAQGLLTITPGRWQPSLRGMALADRLALQLVEGVSP